MKNVIVIGGVTTAIAIASLAGCSTTMSSSSSKKANDERSDGRVVDDDNITKAVESKLKSEPVYKFDSVGVKTYAGIVALSGFVSSADQSYRAEQLARGVGGVNQVVNGLVVKPGPIPSATGSPSGQQRSSQPPPANSTSPAPNN